MLQTSLLWPSKPLMIPAIQLQLCATCSLYATDSLCDAQAHYEVSIIAVDGILCTKCSSVLECNAVQIFLHPRLKFLNCFNYSLDSSYKVLFTNFQLTHTLCKTILGSLDIAILQSLIFKYFVRINKTTLITHR